MVPRSLLVPVCWSLRGWQVVKPLAVYLNPLCFTARVLTACLPEGS